jgi:hypothetical protein
MTNTTEVTTTETMTHVRKTKRVFNNVRKSNTTLFETIREAYDDLFDSEHPVAHKQNLQWRRYRLEVEEFCDKSSLNKIVSICQNDKIMKNLDRLPVAWSTLSKLNVLLNTDDKTVAKTFIELLDADKINVISTAKSIVELLTPETEAKKQSTSLTVVFYSDQIDQMNEEDRKVFEEASASLVAIGFVMKDMCKKTVEAVKEEASNDASSDATDSTDSAQEAA